MLSGIMNARKPGSLWLCLPITLLASVGAAGEAPADKSTEYELQPLFTHYARTLTKVTFRSTISWFNGVELQEANHFNGATVDAELVVPLSKRFEVMLAGPIYTWGRADLIQPGHPTIDLYGWSGTFQFPNAQLQWQFLTEENSGLNMAVRGGYGLIIGKLHTTTSDYFGTKKSDIYNHGGEEALGGVRLDRRINDWFTVVGDLGVNYYIMSDDLHPKGGGDTWALGTFGAAGVFHPWEALVYPTLELVYNTDFDSYNSVMLVPEVIIPVCSNFECKVGFSVGLTGDGQDYGASFQGVFRF